MVLYSWWFVVPTDAVSQVSWAGCSNRALYLHYLSSHDEVGSCILLLHLWMKSPHMLSNNVTHTMPHLASCCGCVCWLFQLLWQGLSEICWHAAHCEVPDSMAWMSGVPGPEAERVDLCPVWCDSWQGTVTFQITARVLVPMSEGCGTGFPDFAGESVGLWPGWLHSENH